jgi:hypothetical protein
MPPKFIPNQDKPLNEVQSIELGKAMSNPESAASQEFFRVLKDKGYGRVENAEREIKFEPDKEPETRMTGGLVPRVETVDPNAPTPMQKLAAGPAGGLAESVLTSWPGKFAQGALREGTNIIVDTPRAIENITTTKFVPEFLFGKREKDEGLFGKLGRTYEEADERAFLPGAKDFVQPAVEAGDFIREEIGEERDDLDKAGEITTDILALGLGAVSGARTGGRIVSKIAQGKGVLAKATMIPKTFNRIRRFVMESLMKEGFKLRQVREYVHNLKKLGGIENKYRTRLYQLGNDISEHLHAFKNQSGEKFYSAVEKFMKDYGNVRVSAENIKNQLSRIASAKSEHRTAGLGNWATKELKKLDDVDDISVSELHSMRRALKNKYAKYKGKSTEISTTEEQALAREVEKIIGNTIDSGVEDYATNNGLDLADYGQINKAYADDMATVENIDRILKTKVRAAGTTKTGEQPKYRRDVAKGLRDAEFNDFDMQELVKFGNRYSAARPTINESRFVATAERIANNFGGGELGAAFTIDKSGKLMPRARTTPEWIKTRPRAAAEFLLKSADAAADAPVISSRGPASLAHPFRTMGTLARPTPGSLGVPFGAAGQVIQGDLASQVKRLKEKASKEK